MQVVSSTPTAQVARSRGTAPVGVGLLVAVAALVLGILGMHALGLHGVGVSHGAPASGVSVAPAADSTGTAVEHGAHHGTVAAADEGHGLPHGAAEMVVLCAAMLAAAAGMLLALAGLRHRAPPVWAELRSALALRVTSRARPGGTGPPAVWEFSVVRC
ncbi:hypothetical protein JOE61_001315 [Nocardioides salarius]|uniref:Uncharacterized protein n=1 Tax=Nocardioides salarius TaxID=374513 RepID=A0ABS2M8K3_9ACTN|nr:hypothetical protein [Nocardioides salarius]MBM7507501.1 hypothetical protein [Nocardioides salarius]